MKFCGRCATSKPFAEFHRWKRGDGFQPWCKACRRAYDRDYHRRTLPRRRLRRVERHREFNEWYYALKDGRPCADCGRVYPPPAMQWDHLPGVVKLGNVGDIARQLNKRRVLEEIAKCELVCASCHAIRTVARRQFGT